jgi:hypothetical protein
MTGFNPLMGFEIHFDNWISNGNTDTMYIQTIKKTCTDWLLLKKRDGLMVFKAAFNNISDIS